MPHFALVRSKRLLSLAFLRVMASANMILTALNCGDVSAKESASRDRNLSDCALIAILT